eukprot:1381524-Rhodomonas_salina.1
MVNWRCYCIIVSRSILQQMPRRATPLLRVIRSRRPGQCRMPLFAPRSSSTCQFGRDIPAGTN